MCCSRLSLLATAAVAGALACLQIIPTYGGTQQIFVTIDANGNERVTREELAAHLEQQFDNTIPRAVMNEWYAQAVLTVSDSHI